MKKKIISLGIIIFLLLSLAANVYLVGHYKTYETLEKNYTTLQKDYKDLQKFVPEIKLPNQKEIKLNDNNSIYFWVIIAIIVLFISEIKLNSDYLKEKVLFSYLILIILRFLGLIPIKFILPFSFIIYFVFIEFIYNKGRSKLIINNPFFSSNPCIAFITIVLETFKFFAIVD